MAARLATRALASVPSAVRLIRWQSGIQNIADLAGKRVSGAPGSGAELNARALLEANGVNYEVILSA